MSHPGSNVIPFRARGGEEPWVTPQRLAEYFEVSVRTVQRWKVAGMPCLEQGGVVRYRRKAAEAWLQEAG